MTTIYEIRHEDGDLAEYDSTVTDGGDLSVAAGAALAGTLFGLSCLIDDTTAIYGVKNLAAWTTNQIRARVYVDPNTITMTTGTAIWFLTFRQTATSVNRLVFAINKASSSYQIYMSMRDDGEVAQSSVYVNITDAPHYIEALLVKATSASANDGYIDWWIDGVAQTRLSGLDIYNDFGTWDISRVGAAYVGSGSGTIYVDEIVCNDDGSEIGPYVASGGQPMQLRGLAVPGMRRWRAGRVN